MSQIPLEFVLDIVRDKKCPYWLSGQNLCNLRDASAADIYTNAEYREKIYLMVREAWECGVLLYDPEHQSWALNPHFGDYHDWYIRWPNIDAILIALADWEFHDEDEDTEMIDMF